jgi:glutamate-1-semialdehyde 2,1-aminomutase
MSDSLKTRAEAAMPGGVNSPVRAFRAVGGEPFFARAAAGATIETTDGRHLLDFCMSFGPLILGHAHPNVVRAIVEAAPRGTSYAVTTEAEIEMAELIRRAIPSMERVRLVSSGTEAAMTALRLARGVTGRDKVLKFGGCYHGHADGMLVQAGSGVAALASASSAGVPASFARETIVTPYNDANAVAAAVDRHGDALAAMVVEPLAANMGLVEPAPGFLEALRLEADRCGALLIFDEVITGFRFTFGGYQNLCGVTPDLTCLGKIIGGGMPIGALGGRASVMNHLAPLGPVYQAGTLSGNPVSVAAGLATLRELDATRPYAALAARTRAFVDRLAASAHACGLALHIPTVGSLFSLFFNEKRPTSFEEVQTSDAPRFVALFHRLLAAGVYLPPSPFEASFLSVAHDDTALDCAFAAFEAAFASVAAEHDGKASHAAR